MRTRCATALATVLAATVLSSAVALAVTAEWVEFVHPQLGFSLTYPKDWVVSRDVTGIAFMAIGPYPAGVRDIRLNVNVTTEQLPASITTDDYDAQNESGLGKLFHDYRRLRIDPADIPAAVNLGGSDTR